MTKKHGAQFYEVQAGQKRKSLLILGILFLFYFAAIGLLLVLLTWVVSLFSSGSLTVKGSWLEILTGSGAAGLFIGLFHYFDARHNGAAFIRRRLGAEFPDLGDRYHQRFANTLEEMRLACGLPKVTPYVLPDFAVNSLALIERDGSPSVLVTEGLLADFTRDEHQAALAHELAHILRGDAFHITLVCSLANVFERFRLALEPERSPRGAAEGGGPPLVYAAVTLSAVVMHLLSTLISRERELLADAVAVEISRSPRALARAIYKAHVKNSFVGDFNLTYSPLFIVPPGSKNITEGFFNRIFNSHPPLMQRLETLAAMAHVSTEAVIEEVMVIRQKREEAREVPLTDRWREGGFTDPRTDRVWMARNPEGKWEGPKTLTEALAAPFFSGEIRMAHLQEGVEASAAEFPQVREKIRRGLSDNETVVKRKELCPHCRIPLHRQFYEGVPIEACIRCGGRYLEAGAMPRIITRKEVAFTGSQIEKARSFRERFLLNPFKEQRITPRYRGLPCPGCGRRLLPRPYNYQYVIPVDKCLGCDRIWFDTDELEILQILIEKIDRSVGPKG
jgi:Zn-dependent protease with chaperone function/Zn-finger nucleic acid-binding protein